MCSIGNVTFSYVSLCIPLFSLSFPLSCSYCSIFVIIHPIFTLLDHENIVPLISSPLFPLWTSFCSLILLYIYLTMGLPHDSLLCTYINSLVGTYSIVRTLCIYSLLLRTITPRDFIT